MLHFLLLKGHFSLVASLSSLMLTFSSNWKPFFLSFFVWPVVINIQMEILQNVWFLYCFSLSDGVRDGCRIGASILHFIVLLHATISKILTETSKATVLRKVPEPYATTKILILAWFIELSVHKSLSFLWLLYFAPVFGL